MSSSSAEVVEPLSTTTAPGPCDQVRTVAPEALLLREDWLVSAVFDGLVLLWELNMLSDRSGSFCFILDVGSVVRPRL